MYLDQNSGVFATIPTVAGLALVLGIVYVLGVAVYNVTLHPLAKFPGPKLWAAFHWPETWSMVRGDIVKDYSQLHRKYGRIVRVGPKALSFTDPQGWKDMYGFRPGKGQMPKDHEFYRTDPAENLPPNIIVANDADHTRYRRSLAHAFSDSALREQEQLLNSFFDIFIEQLDKKIDGDDHGKLNLTRWLNYLTFDIIGELAFGRSFSALEGDDTRWYISNIFQSLKVIRWVRVGSKYPLVFALFKFLAYFKPELARARKEVIEYAKENVNNRLNTETDKKDFLSYVLHHNDEKGCTRDELIVNASLLIGAGSETTATTLSGTIYYLLQNPDKLQILQKEVDDAFSSIDEMTLVSTGKLPYLHAVIEEGLRMYPPVPGTLPRRTPKEGAMIAGEWVAGDTCVTMHQWAANRDPHNFADPDAFAPERFLPDVPDKFKADRKEAMQPFSFGPRNCLGKNLAYSEVRSILARIIFKYDMELCPESKGWVDQKVHFIWEKPRLMVKLSHRQPRA